MGLVAAAGVAAGVITTTVGALECVAAVGAICGVVGAITKNPILSYVGMGLGVIGGVGALASAATGATLGLAGDVASAGASGASSFAADEAIFSGAGAQADASIQAGADAMTTGLGDMSGDIGSTLAANAGNGDIVGALSGGLNISDTGVATALDPAFSLTQQTELVAGEGTAGWINGTGSQVVAPENTVSALTPTGETAAATPATAEGAPAQVGGVGKPPSLDPNAPQPAAGAVTGSPNSSGWVATEGGVKAPPDWAPEPSGLSRAFDKLTKFAGDHPVMALGVMQAGGNLLSGWTSTLTPAQVNLANAQAAANNSAAALGQRQLTASSQPKTVASLPAVTGAPAPLTMTGGNAPGLINQTAQVTGAPA